MICSGDAARHRSSALVEAVTRGLTRPSARSFDPATALMRTIFPSWFLVALSLAAAAGAACDRPEGRPSEFPVRPIRLVLPYGPGGATDIAARIVADRVRSLLGQPIVIEYRPGGSGALALAEVVESKADGYTLLFGNITTNLLNPLIGEPPLPFDPFTQLRPLARLVSIPGVLITTTVDFPPATLQDFLAYARERPGALNYSTSGILAYSHIDWLMLQRRTGVRLVDVPLPSGTGGGQVDIITGRIQASIQNAATVMPFVKAGQVRALAVAGEQRLPSYPDVPTFAEAGFPGIGTSGWQALFARADTPKDAVDTITRAFLDALLDEEVRTRLVDLQFNVIPTKTVDEARGWLDDERTRWTPIVADAKALYQEQEALLESRR
jgi:tripartite-type tricarboxylate transporter receptor subunit TctC